MEYLHKEFDLAEGDIVEVTLAGNAANILLLDDGNFQNYQQKKPYRYCGGYARTSPFRIPVPQPGRWHLVVDLGGGTDGSRHQAESLVRPCREGASLAARKRTNEQLVRIAPLGELRAYTISEHELEKLEQGTPISDLLTIGLCLLSAAVTLLATILSTSLPAQTFLLFFCALLIVGLSGAICTFLGWRLRISTKELARQIRARMPDTPSVQQIAPGTPTGPALLPTSSEPPSPSNEDTSTS